jgi:hypothetical protein
VCVRVKVTRLLSTWWGWWACERCHRRHHNTSELMTTRVPSLVKGRFSLLAKGRFSFLVSLTNHHHHHTTPHTTVPLQA